jgi:hypothetical protein
VRVRVPACVCSHYSFWDTLLLTGYTRDFHCITRPLQSGRQLRAAAGILASRHDTVAAEKGAAAQARFVEKCRVKWRADPGYARRRRGLRTAPKMEHTYAQVDRGGIAAEQLVGWQTRRLARGQPIGATTSGAAGRGRRPSVRVRDDAATVVEQVATPSREGRCWRQWRPRLRGSAAYACHQCLLAHGRERGGACACGTCAP